MKRLIALVLSLALLLACAAAAAESGTAEKESLGILQVLCAVLILLAVVGTNYFGKKN